MEPTTTPPATPTPPPMPPYGGPPYGGPGYGGTNPAGPPPKNWLVESILVTLFCCLIPGIIGIVNAARVNTKWAQGDYTEAQLASVNAGKWTKISFFIGLGLNVIGLILWFLGIGAAIMQNRGAGY